MERTIITVKANSYNDFCYKLRSMYIWDVTVKSGGCRYKLYDNISGMNEKIKEEKVKEEVENFLDFMKEIFE